MANSISFVDGDEMELAGPGQRSGEGSDSVIPYLLEALASRPAPLLPADHQMDRKPARSLASRVRGAFRSMRKRKG